MLHPRRAFSLIESAIVLGVVGLVIGGIWVAASTIYYTMKIQDTAQVLINAADKMHQLYPPRLASSILPANIMPTEAQLFDMGVLPETWKMTSAPFVFVKNPFGIMNVTAASSTSSSIGYSHRLQWRVLQGNKQACIRLLIELSKQVPHQFDQIDTDTTTAVATPASVVTATNACSGSATLYIYIKLS